MLDILIKAGCYVAIIFLGHILRRRGFFGPEAFPVLSNTVIKITLPCAIIYGSAGKAITPSLLTITALGALGGVLYMLAAALLHRKRSKNELAFSVLNTPGYNIGAFAMPFTQGFLGAEGVLTTSLFDVGNAFVCLGGAYGVATAIKAGDGFRWKPVLKALSRSVPFLTYLVVFGMNLLGLSFPTPVMTFVKIGSDANPFLAMLMIGVGFQLSGDREKIGTMARILLTRYSIAIVLALCYYFLLPFSLETRQALVLLTFSPIGAAVPGFTRELGEDVGLSSAINSITIVVGIVMMVSLLLIML